MAASKIHAQKAHAATRGLFVAGTQPSRDGWCATATVSSRNAGDNAAGAPETVPPGYPEPK